MTTGSRCWDLLTQTSLFQLPRRKLSRKFLGDPIPKIHETSYSIWFWRFFLQNPQQVSARFAVFLGDGGVYGPCLQPLMLHLGAACLDQEVATFLPSTWWRLSTIWCGVVEHLTTFNQFIWNIIYRYSCLGMWMIGCFALATKKEARDEHEAFVDSKRTSPVDAQWF